MSKTKLTAAGIVAAMLSMGSLAIARAAQLPAGCSPRVAGALAYFDQLVGSQSARLDDNGILIFDRSIGMNGLPSSVGANSNFGLVDAIATNKGAAATIFGKSGSDFIRLVTNLTVGATPAVGTLLNSGSASYAALASGHAYCGAVKLFGNNYDAGYEPLFDRSQTQVIGALFVGFLVPAR